MAKYRILDMLIHGIFVGLFCILFLILYRLDQKQMSWYNEDKATSVKYIDKLDTVYDKVVDLKKIVDRLDRRNAISGCLLR